MRFIIIATIDQRTESCRKLKHSYVKILSERVGCKIRFDHSIRRLQNTNRLTRKINSRILTESKNTLVLTEFFRSDCQTNLHQGNVTWIFHNLCQILLPVSTIIIRDTFNLPFIDLKGTAAVIGLIAFQCTNLQTCCNRKWFDRRSRLKSIAHAEVSPEFIQSIDLIVTAHSGYFFLCIILG